MSKAQEIKARLGLADGPPQARSSNPPDIPDHTLLRRIGEGSYGDVWLARNVVGTHRAVKIVYRDSFRDERPYQREFDGIQRFEPISRSSDGFVHILQIGRNDSAGCFYYIMELADDINAPPTPAEPRNGRNGNAKSRKDPGSSGTTRTTRLQARFSQPETYVPKTLAEVRSQVGRLPVAECVALGLVLTRALAHLHEHDLLHRDIKPSNIIFVHGAPKLADIGLVAGASEARSFVGTEGFIPPEGPNSPQADIYSLGKVLYEIAMGRDRNEFPDPCTGLWDTDDAEALLELNAVILKACATDRRERYLSAREMETDLELIQQGKSVRRQRALRSRLRLMARCAGGIALLVLAAYGLNSWMEYRVHQLQSRPSVGAGPLAGRVPPRDARATPDHLDLAAHFNVLFEGPWFGPQGNNLAPIPRGLQTLGDVGFDLRGIIQLGSPDIPGPPGHDYPRSVHGLMVGRPSERLHFLHGTISGVPEGREIGRYVVHYADGARRSVPIRYGVELRDCWGWTGEGQAPTNAVVAWQGQNPVTLERGFDLRLYRTTWENPLPGVPIASLDFVTAGTRSAPFLLAITADPHLGPADAFEPDLLDQIQAHTDDYPRVRVGRAFGQPEFQTVRLNTGARRAGAVHYDAIRFVTPPEPGWDLVWVTTFVGIGSCEAWQIAPLQGALRVGFEDWYHGSIAHYADLAGATGRGDVALQFLDGKKLRPNTEYLIWFVFSDDQPVELYLAINFVPPGRVFAGRPETIEAALGLKRVEHLADAGGITQHINCGPGLHRHFCLGISHW
jgi:hypothetical protein